MLQFHHNALLHSPTLPACVFAGTFWLGSFSFGAFSVSPTFVADIPVHNKTFGDKAFFDRIWLLQKVCRQRSSHQQVGFVNFPHRPLLRKYTVYRLFVDFDRFSQFAESKIKVLQIMLLLKQFAIEIYHEVLLRFCATMPIIQSYNTSTTECCKSRKQIWHF